MVIIKMFTDIITKTVIVVVVVIGIIIHGIITIHHGIIITTVHMVFHIHIMYQLMRNMNVQIAVKNLRMYVQHAVIVVGVSIMMVLENVQREL